MCNLYTQTKAPEAIRGLFSSLQRTLLFPEGVPNLQPRDICITDQAPIVRAGRSGDLELVVRRWSWPGPGGKPVYNYRSDGRELPKGRILILADGFYEFTKSDDLKQKRKDRWLFTQPDEQMIGIAGLARVTPEVGEAFTMLTCEPGPDVAPYHSRQVAVLPPSQWGAWLDHSKPATELIGPLPAGTLNVAAAPRID